MSAILFGLLASMFLSFAHPLSTCGDEQLVYWGRKKVPIAELSDDMPQSARAAVELWASWAQDNGYRMDLAKNGMVLLLSLDGNKARANAVKNFKWIEKLIAYADEILPLPATRVAAKPVGEGDDSYEVGRVERETQTVVLLELDDLIHYSAAVNHLVAANKLLGRWASIYGRETAFIAESPLAAACLPETGFTDDYESEPENELANRLAQMLLLRRFGQQPYWIRMGLAWHIEMEILRGVYCFPDRSGAVSTASHTVWDKRLVKRMEQRKEPLEFEEVAELERGTWNTEAAEVAWGTATFLVEFHGEALPQILDELYALWDEGARDDNGDGTWERIEGYEPPLDAQLAVFQKHVPDFLPELLKFFAKGQHYKP